MVKKARMQDLKYRDISENDMHSPFDQDMKQSTITCAY
jgi:hypothetical protein